MEASKHGLGEDESCHTWVSYLTQFEVCQVEVFFFFVSSGAITASSKFVYLKRECGNECDIIYFSLYISSKVLLYVDSSIQVSMY